MIKATGSEYEKNENGKRYVIATLVSDTVDEVITNGISGTNVEGLQANDVMTFGSTCMCITGEFGMLDSSNTWQFN